MNQENRVKTYWNETWVKIETPSPTKKTRYYISNHGRIKSEDKTSGKENLLKGSVIRTKHRVLNIKLANKKNLAVYVHKFVAKHFIPKENPECEFVTHLDKDKNNNHWKNLKWLTRKELSEQWVEMGMYDMKNKKVQSKNVKLTESKVKRIKQWLEDGKTKKKIIAKNMKISVTQLKRIERGENWGYVKAGKKGISCE